MYRGLLLVLIGLTVPSSSFAQRSKPVVACKSPVFAALKPMPKLSYQCNEQFNDYDEKILKLPERLAAINTLMSELASFNDAAWWSADPVDLSVCDFAGKTGTLTRDLVGNVVQRNTYHQATEDHPRSRVGTEFHDLRRQRKRKDRRQRPHAFAKDPAVEREGIQVGNGFKVF